MGLIKFNLKFKINSNPNLNESVTYIKYNSRITFFFLHKISINMIITRYS